MRRGERVRYWRLESGGFRCGFRSFFSEIVLLLSKKRTSRSPKWVLNDILFDHLKLGQRRAMKFSIWAKLLATLLLNVAFRRLEALGMDRGSTESHT